MLDANHVFYQMLLESVVKEKLCFLTTLFRWSIEGVGQESRGRGTEEWMLTLTLPPRHLRFLKVAKKSYFKKSTNVPIYSRGLRSNFHFVKFRKTEVWQLTLALPRHLSREKITRSVLRFEKFQHSMLQKYLLASFMSLKIRSQNFMNWCYKIFSFHFYFPKNPHSTPGSWKIGFTMEFQIRPGALVPSLWGIFNRHATRKLRCSQQDVPPKKL